MLEPIAKKRSIEGESLLVQEVCFLRIYLNDDCVDNNAHANKNQNYELSCGKLYHNVGISQFFIVDKEQEQFKMNRPK